MITAALGWLLLIAHEFSLGAGLASLVGAALIAAGVMTLNVPLIPSRWVIVAGGVLLAAGLLWQAAFARATREEHDRNAAAVLATEHARAVKAEIIVNDQAARAATDAADLAAANSRLQELDHALSSRSDRDRVVLPRDLAIRLRGL